MSLEWHMGPKCWLIASLVARDTLLMQVRDCGSLSRFMLDKHLCQVLIDSLLMGVKDGADILSLSIGGADGWTSSAAAVVASRIARSGKIVTIAAANDVRLRSNRGVPITYTSAQGTSGSWYSSGTGNAIDAISCGSVEKYVTLVCLWIFEVRRLTEAKLNHSSSKSCCNWSRARPHSILIIPASCYRRRAPDLCFD